MKTLILFLLFASLNFSQSSLLLLMSDDELSAKTKAYQIRVLADGGEIINIDAVEAAYKDAINNGYYDSLQVWVSASFGIKKNANNKTTKLYNLIGTSDFAQADTAKAPTWYADSLSGKPTLKFDGSSDVLISSIPVNFTYGGSIIVVQSLASNAALYTMVGANEYLSYVFQNESIGITTKFGGSTGGTNALRTFNILAVYTNYINGMTLNPDDTNRVTHYRNGTAVANGTMSAPNLTWNGDSYCIGAERGHNATLTSLNLYLGNISEILISKDLITSPYVFLNGFYNIY